MAGSAPLDVAIRAFSADPAVASARAPLIPAIWSRNCPHAAGAGVNEAGVPGRQRPGGRREVVGRHALGDERRRHVQPHVVGNGHDHGLGRGGVFGVASLDAGKGHPVAHGHAGYRVSDGARDARAIDPDARGERRRVGGRSGIVAVPAIDVRVVDSRVGQFDNDLVLRGRRFRRVPDLEHVDSAEGVDFHRFHVSGPPAADCRRASVHRRAGREKVGDRLGMFDVYNASRS